jgi:protein tyrosine phosphatase type 4A
MQFLDGASPPTNIILEWIKLVDSVFGKQKRSSTSESPCIAIHCVAGLGR